MIKKHVNELRRKLTVVSFVNLSSNFSTWLASNLHHNVAKKRLQLVGVVHTIPSWSCDFLSTQHHDITSPLYPYTLHTSCGGPHNY